MKIRGDYIVRKVGGQSTIVQLGKKSKDDNATIVLTETTLFIWNKLKEEIPIEEIKEGLIKKFAITDESANSDIKVFTDVLKKSGIVE